VTEATIADRRVHPATILLRFLKEAPSTLLAIPAGVAILSRGDLYRALAVAAVVGVLLLFFNWLAWSRFRYGVGSREIVIESGILHRNRRSIPFDRVQDVDIERAMLARLVGLAKVRIETGAGGKDEGVLDSVTVAEADRLRAAVRAWHAEAGAMAVDADEPAAVQELAKPQPEGRLLFAMDVRRVLLFGLFSFSLVYIASLFAFLQTFDRVLPFDIYDPARWIGLVEHSLPQRFTFVAIGFLLFVAVILGIAAGVLRTLARDYGYRLVAEGRRFRRERGLFTRTEAVIAKARVQLALVTTGPIRGWFGWSGLHFQTLGAASNGSGMQAAAPFAKREEMEPILAEAGTFRLPLATELTMVSNRHIVRALAGSVAPALLAIAVASVFFPAALFLLTLLPVLAAEAALQRRFHRFALDGDLLFIARGVWRRRLWVVPVRNTHALSVERSWLQRRLGLASLSVDTAGAPAMKGARIVDLRLATAQALATELAAARRLYSGRKSGTDR
jgi:putative membrane protein